MNDTPQLDMHIYLRGTTTPVYLPSITAHTAEAIVEDLTTAPLPAEWTGSAEGWYVLEDGERTHRLRRADVQRISTAPAYVPPAPDPEDAGIEDNPYGEFS